MIIESPQLTDLEAILRVAQNAQVFTADEIDIIHEMFDGFFHPNSYNDHSFIVCRKETDNAILGFAVYGPVPMTDRVWDLYWICTDSVAQGTGIGGALLNRLEEDARSHDARAMYLETSDSERYMAARRFYEHHNWQRTAHLPDYYAVGEGMLIFRKVFK
jgi:GNAT superfamily N-acetyltransferase